MTSWITFAEVLVKPLQTGNAEAEAGYRSFFVPSPHFEIVLVDKAIPVTRRPTFALCTVSSFRDAIHIATGMAAGCTYYLPATPNGRRPGYG